MKLGGGGKFAKLKGSVASGYEKKGMSTKKAEKIGSAVAAKIGMEKYWKAKMSKMASAGKKKK